MSDLISRSELLKAMNTWDKFGYDCHRGRVRMDSTNEEYVHYVRYEDTVKCANDMQTASDVVVEELEKLKMRYFLTIANTGDEKSDFAYENVGNALDKAIEIVKQGGVSDDVCEWKYTKEIMDNAEFKVGCNKNALKNGIVPNNFSYHDFKYCPYCGKKIKVVE